MGYLELYQTGELEKRVQALEETLAACNLCPHTCGANRQAGERGKCGAGKEVEISGYGPHFGEEPPLVGLGGSGTIFFAFCSLACVFCQNYEISRGKERYTVSLPELAQIMLKLQRAGCVNINFVTPTHYVPQIVKAVALAVGQGLHLPLVYNSSGYERQETLQKLDGIIDIYLPDLKYADTQTARKYSRIDHYPEFTKAALREMHRQVGDLVLNRKGVATQGLLIRHLILPNGLAGTAELMEFIAREISPTSWINLMTQYRPVYLASRYPELSRRITHREFEEAVAAAQKASPWFYLL